MTSLCRLDLGPYGPTLQFQSRIKQRQHFDFSHVVFPKNLRRQIDVLLAEDIIFEGLFWVHGWDPAMLFISQCHPKSPAVPRPDPWPLAPSMDRPCRRPAPGLQGREAPTAIPGCAGWTWPWMKLVSQVCHMFVHGH